jgi:Cu(I)/Ag(I) efflux system membrane fusion protein
MVSDMLYDLIKNTGLKGDTVYHQYCPMAFDDKGAYWLSSQSAIRNPYFGKEMLTCGNTKDTLIYK